MKHLRPLNKKAQRIGKLTSAGTAAGHEGAEPKGPEPEGDVMALQQGGGPPAPRPHVPMGCSLAFSPGWEVDSAGGASGLCQPVERDIYDCYVTCFWPAQVPDHLNNYPDWAAKCASATKDWRNLDLVFP